MGSIISSSSAYRSKIHFPSTPARLWVKSSQNSKEKQQLSLREFVESRCPTLFSDFHPAWWLFNGHLQTIYCVFGDFSKIDKVLYDRKFLRLLDGGTLGLDFTPLEGKHLRDDTPIVVVLHGLTGGSYESYVRAILQPACAPVEEGGLGYRGVVMNFRGCAGVPITSSQLYSAGHTDDIRQALIYIAHRYPKAPLLGVGFSLGANVLTRYVAEEGENSRVLAACALGCPWDLTKNNKALESSLVGRLVYSKGMGGNLLRLLKFHTDSLSKDPDHQVTVALGNALKLKSPTLEEFDNTFTRVAGGSSPPFPFVSAADYYQWASSHKVLTDVKIPFLAINSADDPVVNDVPMDAGDNENVVMVLTRKGGHLGWFEGGGKYGHVERWVKKPVLEWLRAMGEDLAHEGSSGYAIEEKDGYLVEVGQESLGCKEIDGGGLVIGTDGEEGLLQGL